MLLTAYVLYWHRHHVCGTVSFQSYMNCYSQRLGRGPKPLSSTLPGGGLSFYTLWLSLCVVSHLVCFLSGYLLFNNIIARFYFWLSFLSDEDVLHSSEAIRQIVCKLHSDTFNSFLKSSSVGQSTRPIICFFIFLGPKSSRIFCFGFDDGTFNAVYFNSCGYTYPLPEVSQWVIGLGWDRLGFPVR